MTDKPSENNTTIPDAAEQKEHLRGCLLKELQKPMPTDSNVTDKMTLKPCPFCGAEVMPRHALWIRDGSVDSIIHAAPSPECGVGDFSVYSADDGVTVAAAWNRRA